jgi:hypothetical protein
VAKFLIGFTGFTTSTAAKTCTKIIGASAKLFEMVEVGMFGDGRTAAADIMHEISAGFLTNGGAGTPGASPTPEKMNQASAVSGLTAGTGYSAETTTYTTNVFTLFSFNQRGGMRWSVPQGEGYKSDGTQTNLSVGTRSQSSAAGTIGGNCMWWE